VNSDGAPFSGGAILCVVVRFPVGFVQSGARLRPIRAAPPRFVLCTSTADPDGVRAFQSAVDRSWRQKGRAPLGWLVESWREFGRAFGIGVLRVQSDARDFLTRLQKCRLAPVFRVSAKLRATSLACT
jgi:hypothetical protein